MNYKTEIPVAMIFAKYYCRKCGERLKRAPVSRTVSKGDPDYGEHNGVAGHTRFIGDVRLTEYVFACCGCDERTDLDAQRVVARIQKKLGKRVLTDDELEAEKPSALRAEDKKRKVMNAVVYTLFWGIMIGVCLYAAVNKLY